MMANILKQEAWVLIISHCCQTQVHMTNAQWGQTNQNIRVWIRKKFSVRAKQEEQVAHAQKTQITQWFSGKSFEKQIWDEGCRVCDLLVDGELTGWFFQECQLSTFMIPTNVQSNACAQSEVTILHLDGSLSSCRTTQRYMSQFFFFF